MQKALPLGRRLYGTGCGCQARPTPSLAPAYSIRQHTSAYATACASIRQHTLQHALAASSTSLLTSSCLLKAYTQEQSQAPDHLHTSTYATAYAHHIPTAYACGPRTLADLALGVVICLLKAHTRTAGSPPDHLRQHTSAYSMHTSAYVSIRQHAAPRSWRPRAC